MMPAKAKCTSASAFSPMKESPKAAAGAGKEDVWEVRPGGMLVQKRDPNSDGGSAPIVPAIRVKVRYAGVYHEVYISSQASFGELKKLLAARTGLHPEGQKMLFKDKEMDSKAFLDTAGVKDRSKIVVLEDPIAQARRLLELRRTDRMEKASKSISRISLEVNKLASKVSTLETIVNKGGKVVESEVTSLTESLMNELIKLDSIAADGDLKAQKQVQERRVQKYVETLDAIKLKNATARANGHPPPKPQPQPQPQQQQQRRQSQETTPVAVKTKWETFDLLSAMPASSTPAAACAPTASAAPRLEWELF